MKTEIHRALHDCRLHRQVRPRHRRPFLAIPPLGKTLFCFALGVLFGPVIVAGDKPASFDTLGAEYERDVRPLLKRFCLDCHSSEQKEGELDLQRFATLAEVRQGTEVWLKVVEMLAGGEMPPEDSSQPSPQQRKELHGWVKRYLDAEALASAGDPGPVVLRRLDNAAYTYTIRDLTGVALDPAREFPTEGAAGEGFTNVGDALVMSPALLRKYLDAGKEIAGHAVLLPDGFRFSPHTTRRDWTDEILAEIRAFYAEFSEVEKLASHYGPDLADAANLGNAGRLPLEKYFAATLAERDSLTTDDKTIEAVAADRGLNAKYLGILWSKLTGDERSLLLDDLRSRWRSAKSEDAVALADHVATWQKGLWTFNPVGLLERKASRSTWQEPVMPLVTQHELRFKFPERKEGEQESEEEKEEEKEFVLSLLATDAGDGNEHDFVVWQQPRLVAEGQPDILLRDVAAASSRRLPQVAPETHPVRDAADASSSDFLLFGRHPNGQAIDPDSLCVRAPAVIEIRLPAKLAAGRELVTTAVLEQETGGEGSVQPDVVAGTPDPTSGLLTSEVIVTHVTTTGLDIQRTVSYLRPILVTEKSNARKHFESAMEEYRSLFPAALCYTQIVPVDEILTLTLFYREDHHLGRLMLDDAQQARLDQLWQEMRYVSREPFRLVDVLDSLLETTNGHPQEGIFDSLVKPFNERADAFRNGLIDSQPRHVDALVALASRAYRRPLSDEESSGLRDLYRRLHEQALSHEEAFRLTLARVFVASAFLYRLEVAPERPVAAPVSDWELANRLSYFLWSSMPDAGLRAAAEDGRLTSNEAELLRQTHRMLHDPRVRRLATEFACQYLHIYDFDPLAEKSEKHFPEFADLRGDMYEESILLFTDLFQNDGSLLSLLDADHTFVNERLARFYGIQAVEGVAWRRQEGIRQHGRGGILALATTLAQQSGATRTSPILRGNWVSEVLLGEKLPRPPQNVPQLSDSVPEGLTERQLIERHSSDATCAKCHERIDPFGFALENYDAIGRRRETSASGRPIDARTTLPDGTEIEGISGLRDYLLDTRRDQFIRQFCRKLLGFSLGREVQLSDKTLLDDIMERLSENDYRFSVAVEKIVLSNQFHTKRGR